MTEIGKILLASSILTILSMPLMLFWIWLSGEQSENARYLNQVQRDTLKVLLSFALAGIVLGTLMLIAGSVSEVG